MIVFYARPYMAGRNASALEPARWKPGALNMSGELLLSIAYGAAMILAGAIAYRVAKKDYALKSRRDEEP